MRLHTLIFPFFFCGAAACQDAQAPATVTPSTPAASSALAVPLPGDSLYQLEVPLVDQDGQTIPLSVFQGHPVLISMFYASCPSACPMLIQDVLSLEAAMTAQEQGDLRVLLVSLDPERDSPESLREVIVRHKLDERRWRLTSPPPDQVREIAAVLGIAYQRIEGGELHHSSIITLLDAQGRIAAQTEGLRQEPGAILSALQQQ